LLETVVSELAKCKLDLMAVQEVRWSKGGSEQAGNYAFFRGNGNDNCLLGKGFFVCTRIISACK